MKEFEREHLMLMDESEATRAKANSSNSAAVGASIGAGIGILMAIVMGAASALRKP